MHRWIGAEATGSIGLAASQFQLTDKERLLRDLAYPLIEPPRSRPAWKSVFGDYQPLPSPWQRKVAFDRTAYGRMLIDEPHRSHTSRYSQLMDDVRNDLVAVRSVLRRGRARARTRQQAQREPASSISELSPAERADAIARMQENTLIVQWVQQCLQRRVASYRWALERLVHSRAGSTGGRCRHADRRTRRARGPSAGGGAPRVGRRGGVEGVGVVIRRDPDLRRSKECKLAHCRRASAGIGLHLAGRGRAACACACVHQTGVRRAKRL